ncbi:MAG: hypothetical protein HN348_30805, partial [Proteobacteria bacterium]|nr:hypothetical protein [Pseudomonadota bacterium]
MEALLAFVVVMGMLCIAAVLGLVGLAAVALLCVFTMAMAEVLEHAQAAEKKRWKAVEEQLGLEQETWKRLVGTVEELPVVVSTEDRDEGIDEVYVVRIDGLDKRLGMVPQGLLDGLFGFEDVIVGDSRLDGAYRV